MLLFSTFFPQFPHIILFHIFPTLFPHYPYPRSKFNIFCGIIFSFIKIRLQQLINIPSNFSFSFMFLCLMTSLSNIP
jgi:hypothetical protein